MAITFRRVVLLVVASVLPFVLSLFGAYMVETHTKDGRLAIWLVFHSQTMTDEQLAQAIGEDPFAVIRRASLMAQAVAPVVVFIVGIFVAFVERQVPGRMVAFALTPFFLWDFYMSAFSSALNPAQTMLRIAKILGTSAACMAMAVLTAVAIARLLTRRRPIAA